MNIDNAEEAEYYDQLEYETKPHEVACRICGWTDQGSQMDLEIKGWALSSKGEVCPKCSAATLGLREELAA